MWGNEGVMGIEDGDDDCTEGSEIFREVMMRGDRLLTYIDEGMKM